MALQRTRKLAAELCCSTIDYPNPEYYRLENLKDTVSIRNFKLSANLMHTCARIFDLLASISRNDNQILTTLSMDNIWDDKRVIPDMDVTVG